MFRNYVTKLMFAFAVLSFNGEAIADVEKGSLVSDDEKKEVALFYSMACASCLESLLLINKLKPFYKDVEFVSVPFFTKDKWRAEARLSILLNLSSTNYVLSYDKRVSSGFSISLINELKDDKRYMLSLLRSYGMKFTIKSFNDWWRESEKLINSADTMIDEIGVTSNQIPVIRVYNGAGGVDYYDASDSILLLKQLMESLK